MIIQKVRIENFRGFHKETIIDFGNKPFILLSAPNGIGKTSVIDAIEWCLTGNIGRLKIAYNNRSTNSDERKKNLDGILKNKNAATNEWVQVELTFIEQDVVYTLLRKQKKDELNAKTSVVELNGSDELAECWLRENIGDSFYKYHFCDIQKSFEMQNKKRDSLPEMFETFISDYSDEKIVATNLEIYAEDVERTIADLKGKEVAQDVINEYKIQLEKYKGKTSITDYPPIIFFDGEKIEIDTLEIEEISQQLNKLYLYGYNVAYFNLKRLVNDTVIRNMVSKLEEIQQLLLRQGKEIIAAIKYGLDKGDGIIEETVKKISQYENIQLSKENMGTYVDVIFNCEIGEFSRVDYENLLKEIEKKEQYIAELDKEIEHLTNGNNVLGLFVDLVSHKEDIIEFRSVSDKCPVCGSEQFVSIGEDQVLMEADKYIRDNSELVLSKNEIRKQVAEQVDDEYINVINNLQKLLENLIAEQKAKRQEYENLKNQTMEYFKIRNLVLNISAGDLTIEQLNSHEYVGKKIEEIKSNYLSDSEKALCRQEYMNILTLLGYKYEDEEEAIIAERMKVYYREDSYIKNYSYQIFTQKVNAIKSILDNKEYLEIKKKLKSALENNSQIETERGKLYQLKSRAEQRSERILQLVTQLEKEEYAAVGPSLKKYYKKLARIDAIDAIDIVLEDNMISIVDEKKKNIVNILSNGQLSVFMLSYFFAGITTRSKTEKCKIYFIDDLTACMDDVNMLAFLDLLKYQMLSEERNMEQIFFVTCDSKICRLLRYKMDGCGIDYCELGEKDFA